MTFSSLISLVLSDNQLSGAVPPELEDLSNLTQLFLHDNQLSGASHRSWATSPLWWNWG